MFTIVFSIVVLFSLYLLFRLKKRCRYWQEREVACVEPAMIIGNISSVLFRKKSYFELTVDLYRQFPNERYSGFYQLFNPILLIRDLELIKKVEMKDFDYFTDHMRCNIGRNDEINECTFDSKPNEWQSIKCELKSALSHDIMTKTFISMSECAENLTDYLLKMNERVMIQEIRSLIDKFSNDVIASSIFGTKCNTYEDPDNTFYKMHLAAMNCFRESGTNFPQLTLRLCKLLNLSQFPEDVVIFFSKLVKDILEEPPESSQKSTFRPNMMHILIEAAKCRLNCERCIVGNKQILQSNAQLSDGQNEVYDADEMIAQLLLFCYHACNTVSLVSTFMAYELALNIKIQKTLQKEIQDTLQNCGDSITYGKVAEMKFMSQVISETLRKWPPCARLDRHCAKNYVILPARDREKPLFIPKGQSITIPVSGIHRDSKYYSDPNKFDPERFSDENSPNIVPGSYLPFGIGSKSCLGSEFALLEVKVLFFHVLSKFDLVPIRQTQVPLRLSRKECKAAPEKGLWLGLKPKVHNVL